ncbi:ATP-binding protein [Archangium sp.]|uniref:AAA family ATPase n=1 Tax=Archangium sp. TaxID=1872627 RepID=UPI002D5A7DD1|nr:ATP-binding protein [Archangium sp.]HYO54364.1 ATP-binding protein [Archangium sp.]
MTDLVQIVADLVRLGLAGDVASVRRLASRLTRANGSEAGEDARLRSLLTPLLEENEANTRMRRSSGPRPPHVSRELPPVDDSSFFPLVVVEESDSTPEPILPDEVARVVRQIVAERKRPEALRAAGLEPTRTLLLTGAPGVGKTMTARYLAAQVGWPLFTVDLAALVSSLLGKTGQNLRQALNFGHRNQSVLLLDEFDALAKRRDDDSDVGELKRIVNVLLQEIDRWPASGLLVAATNHPELLDRAVWRRFERVLELKPPGRVLREAILRRALAAHHQEVADSEVATLAIATDGMSGSDLGRLVAEVVRDAVVGADTPLAPMLLTRTLDHLRRGPEAQRVVYAGLASSVLHLPQREIAEHLDVSHVTVGKYVQKWEAENPGSARTDGQKRRKVVGAHGK